jgi:hypothetical protein
MDGNEGQAMIPFGTPVDVYWNLHRDVFSVRSRRREDYGKVIAHVDEFTLWDVKFVVNESGRQRVLAERRKNVHALVRGYWAQPRPVRGNDEWTAVRYNPYEAPYEAGSFRVRWNSSPITTANLARGYVEFGKGKILAEVAEIS